MRMHGDAASPSVLPPPGGGTYRVGTLTYTKAGLAALFFWLLWGDFCFTMLETVMPSIVPLKLKELNAPNWLIGAILTSIPQALNMIMNPMISTASDRHRGRWGRRIPYMLYTVPFVGGALCLIGVSPDIGRWLYATVLGQLTGWSQTTVTVGAIAATVGLFKFADLFVNVVFMYLVNDVVPQVVMARFLGLFRMIGTSVAILYNYLVFPHALTHMRVIFLVAGLLYTVGFLLMCLRVKEGEYPPPAPRPHGRTDWRAAVKAYLAECLGHRVYGLFFLINFCLFFSYAIGVFCVFLNLSLGLTMQQIGTMQAAVGVVVLCLTYPAGALVDRYHPMRLMVWVQLAMLIVAPTGFIWLFTAYSATVNYRIVLALSMISLPMGLINAAATLPLTMRLFPRQQFGQFCSFNASCGAVASVVAGVAAGGFIDFMRRVFPDAVYGKDYCYRLIPCWSLACISLSCIFLALLYREWQRLGGEAGYRPPMPCVEEGA